MNLWTRFWAWFTKNWQTTPIPTDPEIDLTPPTMPSKPSNKLVELTPSEIVYSAAKNALGLHLTLNNNVPQEEWCAEAVSTILRQIGYPIPPQGIPNVNGLISWMTKQGFKEVKAPQTGAIIAAHHTDVEVPLYAHIGICLIHGIGSNNSMTGKFDEYYSYASWRAYFEMKGGSVSRYFVPV